MLLVLSEEFQEIDRDDHRLCNAIDEIGRLCFQGHHIVSGSARALRACQELEGLSARARQAFYIAARDRFEVGGLARELPLYGHVNTERRLGHIEYRKTSTDQTELIVSAYRFSELGITHTAPILLAENGLDADWYKVLADAWIRRYLGPGLTVASMDSRGCGGSGIVEEALRIQAYVMFLFVVVDSDKKGFSDNLGEVARAAERELNGVRDAGVYVYILPCRFLENTIPVELTISRLTPSPFRDRLIEFLDKYPLYPQPDSTFLNLKDGESLCQHVHSGTESAVERKKEVFKGLCSRCEGEFESGADCTNIVAPGLTRNAIQSTLEELRNKTKSNEIEIFDKNSYDHIYKTASIVASWGIAKRAERV